MTTKQNRPDRRDVEAVIGERVPSKAANLSVTTLPPEHPIEIVVVRHVVSLQTSQPPVETVTI